jgi:hypothetical protein
MPLSDGRAASRGLGLRGQRPRRGLRRGLSSGFSVAVRWQLLRLRPGRWCLGLGAWIHGFAPHNGVGAWIGEIPTR